MCRFTPKWLMTFVFLASVSFAGAVSRVSDPHTFARPEEAVVRHLDLDLLVDFDKKVLAGKAALTIENKSGGTKLYLDDNGLVIDRVTLGQPEKATTFSIGEKVEFLGQPLIVDIRPDTKLVTVYYRTGPQATALQWLDAAQTAGGKLPFLFSQSQSIFARTWIPCQDSPAIRSTYDAVLKVPPAMMAVMSASNMTQKSPDGIYHFHMPQPIPSYLMAIAVGDIAFRSTGPRTGVYADPTIIEKAAWEFADTEKMMQTAEKLYGPYRWERYDLMVLPPSFPFGGMENPRLTFITQSVIVGDRSLVSLIAHELAHSWSGNLVTNATWNDFWLNEGFTEYATHRIMAELYGRELDEMLSVLNREELEEELHQQKPRDTYLHLDLAGRDADDATTRIAYEKGQFFLRTIEAAVGRPKFDAFLRGYFDHFAFQSLTTDQFIEYLRKNLLKCDPSLESAIRIDEWVDGPGIPDNIVRVHSARLDAVQQQERDWASGKPAAQLKTKEWTTQEWLRFL
ncbi:MAG TPA: M1 family aminopeptidase/hydrolase, partial [Acidobacteriota bacterium]|nr:M1 family aminopeptidase/hydrolase [Acidobacteriota bacterium]